MHPPPRQPPLASTGIGIGTDIGTGTRRLTLALGVSLALAACGAKPKPTTTEPVSTAPTSAGVDPDASAEADVRPPERTRGGVELASALDAAGPARAEVWEAAQVLARDRPAGVAQLLAQKQAAKATVLALFASKNLDEQIGALLVTQAEGDPVGVRAEAMGDVLALLDHEVGAVRDVAWATAMKVADGAALATLLPTLEGERRVAVVRLLASWDGPAVEDALWALVAGGDAELALEAALAASAPGKALTPSLDDKVQGLARAEADAKLRLALIVWRRLAPSPDKVSAARKAAVDRALVAKDEPLALEGVRGVLALPPEEREPLLEQLAIDPRPPVRAVTAEVLATHRGKLTGALVTKLLADAEGDVRMAAVATRAQLGTPEERVKALAPLLADPNRGVRLAVAMSLAEPELVTLGAPLLVKQLEREEKEADKAILGALATSGTRVGLQTLLDVLGSGDTERVIAAHFALTTFAKKDFEMDLGAWKRWLDQTYPPPPEPQPLPKP